MKILTAEQLREADAYTIKHEPITSINLMERAANKCYHWLIARYNTNQQFTVFCGVGNNGGDGLAIARLLNSAGYAVQVFVVRFSTKCAANYRVNEARLKEQGVAIKYITDSKSIPKINPDTLIIDAIFGSGLTRPVDGFTATLIGKINQSNAEIIAIDVPSGLFTENNDLNNSDNVILADYTLTFQAPKLSFLFPENGMKVGNWQVLDIGLDQKFIASIKTNVELLDQELIKPILKKRYKFSHKGTFGHALLISGSYGKMGAAVLSSEACLRSGAGLLTVFVPKCGYSILQTSVPEAMVITSENDTIIEGTLNHENYNAIGIGPGIGTNAATQRFLKQLIQNVSIPLIIDADGLNILSQNKTWISFLPEGSIITPHPKEFERLFGTSVNSFARLELQKEQSKRHRIYIILKGAHSCVTCPDGDVFYNSTGNPGMATAGSGDVLTGIITGLRCQGYDGKQSAVLGVYLHGLAGDIAKQQLGEESILARDLIYNLGEGYKRIKND